MENFKFFGPEKRSDVEAVKELFGDKQCGELENEGLIEAAALEDGALETPGDAVKDEAPNHLKKKSLLGAEKEKPLIDLSEDLDNKDSGADKTRPSEKLTEAEATDGGAFESHEGLSVVSAPTPTGPESLFLGRPANTVPSLRDMSIPHYHNWLDQVFDITLRPTVGVPHAVPIPVVAVVSSSETDSDSDPDLWSDSDDDDLDRQLDQMRRNFQRASSPTDRFGGV